MEGQAIKTQNNYSANIVSGAFKGGGLIANRVGYYYNAAKVAYKSINLSALFQKTVCESLAKLSMELQVTTEFIEGSRFFVSLNELFCPDDKGVYFFRNKDHYWQKIAERVSFAAHTFLKMVGACWQWGFINLARISKYAIGHLTIFKLVTDGLFAATSFFSVWDSARQLSQLRKESNQEDKALQAKQNSLYMKLVVYATKVIVVPLSLVFTALNLSTFPCSLTVLSLGVIGDAIGLTRLFHDEFKK